MNDKRDWLILSLKRSTGEVLKWYRTASAGYTMSLLYAGRYTEAEARDEGERCPAHCLAVRVEDVVSFTGLHITMFNDGRTIEKLKLLARKAIPDASADASMSAAVKKYLRLVVKDHLTDLEPEEAEELGNRRNDAWDEMNLEERDIANQLVLDIFGEISGIEDAA